MNQHIPTETSGADFASLMAKPVWSFQEFSEVIGTPESTLQVVLDECPARMFLIGRRRFIKQDDALSWLDEMAQRYPYIPRKNARKGATR